MRWAWVAVLWVATTWLLVACDHGSNACPGICDFDAPLGVDSSGKDFCNPLTQTGCLVGEKCSWIVDQAAPLEIGHIGCAPDGDVATDGACIHGLPGPDGFDDCVKGDVCSGGVCKTICDRNSFPMPTGCDSQHGCHDNSPLFEFGGVIVAGVCDPICDPLTQASLVGSGNTAACGSPSPASPNHGCYTSDFETFECIAIDPPTLTRTDRVTAPTAVSGNPFINGWATASASPP